jgi:3-hydroxyisobutyrate dehydrogenase
VSTSDRGPTIGFVGLGMMGYPMARRLLHAGYPLVVLDQDRDRAERFVADHGGTRAASLQELAGTSEVVITMLPDGHVVRRVLSDSDDSLLDGLRPGSTIIEMSSSAPNGTRELGPLVRERGVHLLDAPVSGGVARALAGELSILVGGTAADLDRCRPVLEQLGDRIFHTGPLGSGHAMKALNNLLSAAGLLATAEVLEVGVSFGLDPEMMLEVLNASTGRNNSTERKFAPHVFSGSYDSGFALAHLVKDLRIALDLARETSVPATLSGQVLASCTEAHEALAPDADHTEIARWVQDVAGARYDGGPQR